MASKKKKNAIDPPLKVFAGFIAEASAKDVIEYAAGIASKHCAAPENAYYSISPWNNGYAYEVHEGGEGRQLLPSILAEFSRTADAEGVEPVTEAYIHGAQRTIRVSRTQGGITAVLLPEEQSLPQSEFVKPGKRMTPWLPRRTGLLSSGAAVFALACGVLIAGSLGRVQPYTAAANKTVERVSLDALPISQMPELYKRAGDGETVTGILFKDGKWSITSRKTQTDGAPAEGENP